LVNHATRRAKIQFVRHGLFQKCNKESRDRFFGNSEKRHGDKDRIRIEPS